MARQEDEREDLIEEAVALIHRLEVKLPDWESPLVAGRRATGAWSFYFGADPAYHFDPSGRLRRAFVDGHLYRTQEQTAARLTRVRTEQETTLVRHDLTPGELALFLKRATEDLAAVRKFLWEERFKILRYVGFDMSPRSALADALHTILRGGVQLAPAIPTRRS